MEVQNCSYSHPLRYNNTVPTNVQDVFNYASSTCTTTVVSNQTVLIGNFASNTASATRGYDGANLNEWLFVVGVFLFFLSWLVWSRISITKE